MENGKEENKTKRINSAVKFSAIGFQMLATIGLSTFIGYRIDQNRKSQSNLITAAFALMGVIIALYQAIKQVTK